MYDHDNRPTIKKQRKHGIEKIGIENNRLKCKYKEPPHSYSYSWFGNIKEREGNAYHL